MLTTIFMPFGFLSVSGSFIIGTFWLIFCLFYFYRVPFGPMVLGYKFLLFIILASVMLGIVQAFFIDAVHLNLFFFNLVLRGLPKIMFLVFIYFVVSNLDHNSVGRVSYRYSLMFIFTIGLSLILYEIFPMPRFVWYANRFAGLHFELVNFSFTAFTAGVILLFSHVRNRLILYFGIAALSSVIYIVSKSNYVPIFIATLVFSIMLLKIPLRLRKLIYLSYFSILICVLLLLPSLIVYLEEILFLFPRSSGTLNEVNPIFIRLYRHIFAIQYFYDNALSFPDGFFNGGFKADLSTLAIPSWNGGSGLSKVFMDFGLLVIPFLILLVKTFLKILKTMDANNQKDQMYFILANLCFSYGYLQAGFFNFTSVSLFLLSLRYWKII